MGKEHDGTVSPGRIGQVLLQGRGQSLGKVWSLKRSVATPILADFAIIMNATFLLAIS
jgi:hypothetical protein